MVEPETTSFPRQFTMNTTDMLLENGQNNLAGTSNGLSSARIATETQESSFSAIGVKKAITTQWKKAAFKQRKGSRVSRVPSLRRAPTRASLSVSTTRKSLRERPLVNNDGDIPPPIPPKSPVLLVRKKSLHSRSRYSNPVRRLFAWLYRHRSLRRRSSFSSYSRQGAYTKDQLTRRLSFDVDFGRSAAHYGVSKKQVLTLAPRLKKHKMTAVPSKPDLTSASQPMFDPVMMRTQIPATTTITKDHQPPMIHAPRPISAQKLLRTPDVLNPKVVEAQYVSPKQRKRSSASNTDQKHLKPTLNLPAASQSMKAAPVSQTATNVAATTTSSSHSGLLGPAFEPSTGSDLKHSMSRRERKKSLKNLEKQASVKRSATKASRRSAAFPIIRRSDIYDSSEDPTVLLDSASLGGRRNPSRLSAFDDPETVDEALKFVKTWSTYLRQAIAVRAKLQEEIRKWEEKEEEQWRLSRMESVDETESYSSTSWDENEFNDLPGSLRSSISDDSISTVSSEELELPDRSSYQQRYRSSFMRQNGNDDAKQIDPRQFAATRSPLLLPVIPETRFSDFFRDSLDPKRISSRYSTLITDSQISGSDIDSFDFTRDDLTNKTPPEAAWLSGVKRSQSIASKRAPGRSVSESTAVGPRPLPQIPISNTRTSFVAATTATAVPETAEVVPVTSSSSGEGNNNERVRSEQILKDMHTEVEELRHKSVELSMLMKLGNNSSRESSEARSFGNNRSESPSDHRQSYRSPIPLSPIDHTATAATDLSDSHIPSHLGSSDHKQSNNSLKSATSSSDGDLKRGGAIRKRAQRKPSSKQQHAIHARSMSIDSAWKSTDSDASSFTSFTNVGLAIIA